MIWLDSILITPGDNGACCDTVARGEGSGGKMYDDDVDVNVDCGDCGVDGVDGCVCDDRRDGSGKRKSSAGYRLTSCEIQAASVHGALAVSLVIIRRTDSRS